ncbi:MAG: serine/threonine-protein kinase, partial [Myxococcota bacterium]
MGGLQRFGPFVVCRSIGRGGMGEVFLARTPWEAQPLAAVKRLRPDVARVPTFRERFRHEAELARRLSHPNLVGTLDIGEVEGQVYVATELVLGKDTGFIADRLRLRSQGGPVAVAIRLLLDGLAGLAYVHGAQDEDGRPLNLVHRDVTPGNLLLGYDGRSRLADFGLAKSYLSEGSGLTKQGEILGTPHYLPPEVVRGERARPASDIYGLGAVAYRFLTGIAPFQGSTSEVLNKVLKERPRPLAELRPDL